jgi:hypothetical protein
VVFNHIWNGSSFGKTTETEKPPNKLGIRCLVISILISRSGVLPFTRACNAGPLGIRQGQNPAFDLNLVGGINLGGDKPAQLVSGAWDASGISLVDGTAGEFTPIHKGEGFN